MSKWVKGLKEFLISFIRSLLQKCTRKSCRDGLIITEAKEIMRKGRPISMKEGRGMSKNKNMISISYAGSSSGYVAIVNFNFYHCFYCPWNNFEILGWERSIIISLAAIWRIFFFLNKFFGVVGFWSFSSVLEDVVANGLILVLGDLHCHLDIEALSSIHNGPFFPP